jgi:hypothetical protein
MLTASIKVSVGSEAIKLSKFNVVNNLPPV